MDLHGRAAKTKESGHLHCHKKWVGLQGGVLDPTRPNQTMKPEQVTAFSELRYFICKYRGWRAQLAHCHGVLMSNLKIICGDELGINSEPYHFRAQDALAQ